MGAETSERRASSRSAALALAVVLAAGVAARIVGAWWYRHSRNPDYAVVVEMARRMAEGREWPVFFYGQSYMGSLEPSASAALAAVFGPDPFWICLGTALFGIALLFAVSRWAHDVGGAWAGVAAGSLAAIGPVGYFQYMASPRGGYALGLLLTVLLLHKGARMAQRSRERGAVTEGSCLLLGFLGGLGFWNFWLTMPALAAAGLVLLAGLRWRILRFRVWGPGALGFMAGSLPFWLWNARNGWLSFNSQESAAGRGQAPEAVRILLTERLPLLLDAHGVPRWQAAAILGAHVLLLGLAAVALRPGRGARWSLGSWSLVTAALYAGAFTAAYALSSFSIPVTPRYLLPFVPLCAVLGGAAVAWTWHASRGARLIVSFLGTAALVTVVAGHARTLPRHRSASPWVDSARTVSTELIGRGTDAVFADYLLYGFNWAADERLCFSSPFLERYPPYARRLEAAGNPAVIENFNGFNHFLDSTGATATYERIAGIRVHSGIAPPAAAVRPLPGDKVRGMLDERGRSWQEPLSDLFASTLATFTPAGDPPSRLDIAFAEPVTVCGVRVWTHARDSFGAWSVEGRRAGSDTFRELSPARVATGYFWSGPRCYLRELNTREEQRFAPEPLEALRLRFHKAGVTGVVRLSELQVLQPDGEARTPDVSAIAEVVRASGINRVYAGRWLANQLHASLEGRVWTSREPSVFGGDNGGGPVSLLPGTGVAADGEAADSARAALRMLGARARETDVGGVTLFLLPGGGPDVEGYRGLRYADGIMTHLHPRALADFWLRRAGYLPPADQAAALVAALDADPFHEGAQRELATWMERGNPAARAAWERAADRRRARADRPMGASFLGGRLALLGVSSWPEVVRPGEAFAFEARWRLAPGFRVPKNLGLFAHVLRDRRIVFQTDVPLVLDTDGFDPGAETFLTTRHSLIVPEGMAAGGATPTLGLCRLGVLRGRLAAETDLPTLQRRIVVPGRFDVVK